MKRYGNTMGQLRRLLQDAKYDPASAFDAAEILECTGRNSRLTQLLYDRATYGHKTAAKTNLAKLKLAHLLISGHYIKDADKSSLTTYIKDDEQAFALIKETESNGYGKAAYLLARAYIDGIGVAQSKSMAIYYLDQLTEASTDRNEFEQAELQVFGSISLELSHLMFQQHNKSASK